MRWMNRRVTSRTSRWTSYEQGPVRLRLLQRGAGRVRQLRREAEKRGLDPNIWFGNVEQIASERIGRETVTYVSNIYKVLRSPIGCSQRKSSGGTPRSRREDRRQVELGRGQEDGVVTSRVFMIAAGDGGGAGGAGGSGRAGSPKCERAPRTPGAPDNALPAKVYHSAEIPYKATRRRRPAGSSTARAFRLQPGNARDRARPGRRNAPAAHARTPGDHHSRRGQVQSPWTARTDTCRGRVGDSSRAGPPHNLRNAGTNAVPVLRGRVRGRNA